LELIKVDTTIFKKEMSWEEVMGGGGLIQDEVVYKTLELSNRGSVQLVELVSEINNYLGEKEEPEESDVILVYGSKDLKRARLAVSLWKEGLAPIIVMAGGKPNYIEEGGIPEATIFRDEAIRLGVPETRIIAEINSITVPDNTRSAMNLMDNLNIPYKRIIIVIAWFAMRRAWVHLSKYGPTGIKIYRTCPEVANANLFPNGWVKSEEGIKVIFNEYVKMMTAVSTNTA
jgi:uncharacterized SAM-binding protein YcdF (DUF218 family)